MNLCPTKLKAIDLTKKLLHGDLILASDIESLRPLYRRLLDWYREVEGRYEAGETAPALEFQQRSR